MLNSKTLRPKLYLLTTHFSSKFKKWPKCRSRGMNNLQKLLGNFTKRFKLLERLRMNFKLKNKIIKIPIKRNKQLLMILKNRLELQSKELRNLRKSQLWWTIIRSRLNRLSSNSKLVIPNSLLSQFYQSI